MKAYALGLRERVVKFNQSGGSKAEAARHFYGVALRYAPTPQAKGKIERRHEHYWQKRLPPLLANNSLSASSAGITNAAVTVLWAINLQLLLKRSS
jgi:hypothetical protein